METILTISTLALLIVLPSLYLSWKRLSSSTSPKIEAPQPAGRLPIIGHLHQLARADQLPFRLFADLADKYGPIFTLFLGAHRTVIINSRELAKECFTTNDKAMAGRPQLVMAKYMGYNCSMFGMASYGPYWREIRKIATLELLSSRQVELHKHIRATEIELSLKDLYLKWSANTASNGYKLPIKVDMKEWLGDLTFNITTMNLAGKRYFGANVIGDEAAARKYRELIDRFFYLAGLFLISDAIPCLEWLDLGGHIGAMKEVNKGLDPIFSTWVKEHRQWRAANPDQPSRDFIDIMLSSLEKPEFADYDSDIVVKSTLLALIIAATDTTAITMSWALALLLKNPHMLKKAQNEIDRLIGNDRVATESDIKDLPYLQAIVKETLRLYPAAPLGAPHMTMEDCEIGGYHVPAKTRLWVNLWKIHRDPEMWEEPLEFRPDRFLAGCSHDLDFGGMNFEFIPFGSGRRMCPGTFFAQQMMHLTMARLLHGFDLVSEEGVNIDMSERLGITLQKVTRLQISLAPRLPPSLYVET